MQMTVKLNNSTAVRIDSLRWMHKMQHKRSFFPVIEGVFLSAVFNRRAQFLHIIQIFK